MKNISNRTGFALLITVLLISGSLFLPKTVAAIEGSSISINTVNGQSSEGNFSCGAPSTLTNPVSISGGGTASSAADQVSINWGDGNTDGPNPINIYPNYTFSGSHTYSTTNTNFVITVTLLRNELSSISTTKTVCVPQEEETGPAHITVIKHTNLPEGQNGPNFNFTITGNDFNQAFTLHSNQTSTTYDVAPGQNYTVTEGPDLPGWSLVNDPLMCQYDGEAAGIPITPHSHLINHLDDAGDSVTCTFTNNFAGITGMKWNDVNNNGAKDEGENLIPGWTIQLLDVLPESLTIVSATAVTDAEGYFYIPAPIAPSTHKICEVPQSGWTQTFPTVGPSHDGVTNCDGNTAGFFGGYISGDPSVYYFGNHQNSAPAGETGGYHGSSHGPTNTGAQGQVLGASTSCPAQITSFLRRGHSNDPEAVKKLQQFLNENMNAGLAVDGNFGLATEEALKKFQLAHADVILTPWGLKTPTGIFYLTTQYYINSLLCPDVKLPPPVLVPPDQNPLFPNN